MTSPSLRPQPVLLRLGGGSRPTWLSAEAAAAAREVDDQPFPDAEYAARLGRVRHAMSEAALDAMVVFRPSSIEYLCGYHTAEKAPQPLLLTASETVLYIPDLEVGRALASARVDQVLYGQYADALRDLESFVDHATGQLSRHARVGVELSHASTPPQAVELLRERVELVHTDHLVERVRLVLSPQEIRCVEQAAVHTQAGVDAAVAHAREPDATDASMAAAIAAALFARADSASAWGPVVATGRRGSIPHSSWTHRRLSAGTTFLEFSGAHHRYHAPVMRTLVRGRPDATARRLSDLATAALAAVLETARPGVPCSEVAEQANAAIAPLPDDTVFHQLFGYPVGLAHPPHWMDGAPFYLVRDNDEPLRAGMVFHVPASFRSLGRSGVGLSQTFLVTEDGARVLTHGPATMTEL